MQKQTLNNPFANVHPPQQFSGQQQVQQQQPQQVQYQQQYQPVQPQQPEQPKEKKKGKKKYLLLLLLLLLIPTIWLFKGFIGDNPIPIPGISWFDDRGVGDLTGKSKEEIKAALNEKVAEGMMNVSMNTNPIFESGTSKGNVRITNIAGNRHPQIVEIYTKDDNTLVISGAVGVGENVEEATLLVDLPKGEYECVAYFSPINPETGERLGRAGVNIKITVLN